MCVCVCKFAFSCFSCCAQLILCHTLACESVPGDFLSLWFSSYANLELISSMSHESLQSPAEKQSDKAQPTESPLVPIDEALINSDVLLYSEERALLVFIQLVQWFCSVLRFSLGSSVHCGHDSDCIVFPPVVSFS